LKPKTPPVGADGAHYPLFSELFTEDFTGRICVMNGTFTVDLAFQGSAPQGLLSGQDLCGKLTVGENRTATVLPAGAFLERTGGNWIFVLTTDGTSAVRRKLKIGRRNAEFRSKCCTALPSATE
jgi:hypothetical protein